MIPIYTILTMAGLLVMALGIIVLHFLSLTVRHGFSRLVPPEPRASVTATLEFATPDRRYVNLVVANAGAAPAFDVRVGFSPAIPTPAAQDRRPSDWADVSLLRPGQAVAAFACETAQIADLEFAVELSWKSAPDAQFRTSLAYALRTINLERQVPLTAPDAESLLIEVRRMRRDWQAVARGRQSLQVELLPVPTRTSNRSSGQDPARVPADAPTRQRS